MTALPWRALVLGCILLLSPSAWGYCRATTCNPADPSHACTRNQAKCLTKGEPLYWESGCITVSVQTDGAPTMGIDYAATQASVQRAFDAWTSVSCPTGSPSIEVKFSEPVSCSNSEYNSERRNANIVMFREREWPYPGAEDALGFTHVRFEPETGKLWDADIEVNAVAEPLSTGDPQPDEVDLDSLLTHEVGHLFGLGHTLDVSGTMVEGYEPGTKELRTLGDDDIAGICAIYPPNRDAASESCEPRHGFSELCGSDQPEVIEEPEDPPATSAGCSSSGAPQPAFGHALLVFGTLLSCMGLRAQKRG